MYHTLPSLTTAQEIRANHFDIHHEQSKGLFCPRVMTKLKVVNHYIMMFVPTSSWQLYQLRYSQDSLCDIYFVYATVCINAECMIRNVP